ncbi:MAG: porin [Burkholderiales bacterium]
MNKKLLVLALAGAFVAPAAMADVTISGTINAGPIWGSSSDATATGTNNSITTSATAKGWSTLGLTSTYSNINLNSTEDIGDGNKVVFNYSFDVSNTGSTVHDVGATNNLKSRNTFIGFEGGWGSLRMGINEHIYERYMYMSDTMDGAAGIGGNLQMLGTAGFGNVFQVANGSCGPSSGCQGFYRRSGNSIWYDSPDISGFTFGIAAGLNAYQASNSGPKPTFLSMGGQFKPADLPFFLNIALERHKDFFGLQGITGAVNLGAGGLNNANATGSTDTALQFGGGFTFGDINIYARFEQLKYKTDGLTGGQLTEYKRNATWLGLKYNLPTGYATIQIGMANDGKCSISNGAACDATKTGATMVTGGYAHNLSKQTQLLFYGSLTNNKELASYVNIGSPSAGPGADGKSIALLVKHSF